MHRGKTLQIWGLQLSWLSKREPPRNSALGAGLKVEISLIPFLQIKELASMPACICVYSITLNQIKFH